MNASLKKVASGNGYIIYKIQAPAVCGALTKSGGKPSERLLDRLADAFASKPVVNFEFGLMDGGKWHVKVLLRAKPAGQRVAERAVAKADYVDTLDTSAKGTHHCPQCMGTGRYVVGLENGAPKFGTGICYRCKGKGQTTDIDRRRNLRYLEHAAARAMSCNH